MKPGARLGRLLNLLPYLKRHEGETLGHICDDLGLQPLELLEDLRRLSATSYGWYSEGDLVDVYIEQDRLKVHTGGFLEKTVRFTPLEMLAIRFGVEYLRALGLGHLLPDLDKALTRLERELGSAAGQGLERMRQAVCYIPASDQHEELLGELLKAIGGRQGLRIYYFSVRSDRYSPRSVNPLSISFRQGAHYLLAYDLDNSAVRTFRVDRIGDIAREDRTFDPPGEEYPGQPESGFDEGGEEGDQRARIRLEGVLSRIAREEEWPALREDPEQADCLLWEPEVRGPHSLIRLLLPFCGECEVLDPPELRRRMRDTLREIRQGLADQQ